MPIGIIINVAIIMIIGVTALLGLLNGAFKAIVGSIGWVGSFIAAVLLARAAAEWAMTLSFLSWMFEIAEVNAVFIGIVALVLFGIFRAVFAIIMAIVRVFIPKNPPKGASRIIGFVVGIFKGLCYVVIILSFVYFATGIPWVRTEIVSKIDESNLAKPLYDLAVNMVNKLLGIA